MRVIGSGLTILASAFLLFGIQPMVGKALLPRLGGVPGAWTACLLFFQTALLVGYGYVWLGARRSLRTRVIAHVALLTLGAVVITPFERLSGLPGVSEASSPVFYALGFCAINVGLAFTVLSASTPLLSSWYADTGGERPYVLYAASNTGSLGALLVYPFLIEPFLDLRAQASVFRWGFIGVALAIAALGLHALFAGAPERSSATSGPALTWRRRGSWVALAFIPSALLVGATSYLTTDLAPVPLLWVVPLAVYLISFIIAFSDRIPAPPPLLARGACLIAVVLVFVTVTHANEPVALLATLHLLFLGVSSWIAHRRLKDDAPAPVHLPEFYVWIAVGGVLGTLVSAVVAPHVLTDLWEYPAAIAVACAARAKAGVVVSDRKWTTDIPHVLVVVGLIVATTYLIPALGLEQPQLVVLLSFGPAAVYAYRWMPLRRRYALCLLALALGCGLTQEQSQASERQLTARSFFGVLRVIDRGDERHLLHGTTLHGTQRLEERDTCVPLSYYVEDGPLGAVFEAHRRRQLAGPIYAVGLGAGSLACYGVAGERWRFVEINPQVIEVASDPRWFTYLDNSAAEIELSVGDGRLALADEADGSLAMIVVDAFNSDSVPAHLLTSEGLGAYLAKLQPGGWVVLHLSNRILDLSAVAANVARAQGAAVRVMSDQHATYAVIAREAEDLSALDPARWRQIEGDADAAWSDAFSSLFSVLL